MYILSFLFEKHTILNEDLAESEIRWNKKDGILKAYIKHFRLICETSVRNIRIKAFIIRDKRGVTNA